MIATKKILVLLIGVALSGCASLQTVQPVAEKNYQNADALNSNLQSFLNADEAFFQAVIEVQVIEAYKDVIKAVQANDNPRSSDMNKIADYYITESNKLKGAVSALSEESRNIEITRYQTERPLTAAVAFGEMLPMMAASKWMGFDAIYRQSAAGANKFTLMRKHFKDLPILERKDMAAADLLQAYADRKAALLQQSASGREMAVSLLDAAKSDSGSSSSGLLQSVSSGNPLVKGFDEFVLKKTGSPDRQNAAFDLLKTLFLKH